MDIVQVMIMEEQGKEFYDDEDYEEALEFFKLVEKWCIGNGFEYNNKVKRMRFRSGFYVDMCILKTGDANDYKGTIEDIKWLADTHKCSEAILQMGIFCETGIYGWPKDAMMAFKYYLEASENNDPVGIKRLANCYRKGIGTTKDIDKAIEQYQRLGNTGDAESQYLLGCLYMEEGKSYEDFSEAKRWMQMAAENGYADVSDELKIIEERELECRKTVGNVKFETVEDADKAREEKKRIDDVVGESVPFNERVRQYYNLDKNMFETEFAETYLADLQKSMKEQHKDLLFQSEMINKRKKAYTVSIIIAVIGSILSVLIIQNFMAIIPIIILMVIVAVLKDGFKESIVAKEMLAKIDTLNDFEKAILD